MSYLTTHASAKTRVLEVLFPNGAWRALLAEIVWELADALFASGEAFTFRVWKFKVTVPRFIVEKIITALVGARP